jgi:hypothetical protein
VIDTQPAASWPDTSDHTKSEATTMRLPIRTLAAIIGCIAIASPTRTVASNSGGAAVTTHAEAAHHQIGLASAGSSTIARTPHDASSTSYRISVVNEGGTPARWDPCQTHPIIVNLDDAPAGAMTDLLEAVRRLDYRTGLRFVITGTTHEPPTTTWGTDINSADPNSAAPVLVAWGEPGTGNLSISGGESGVTSTVWMTNASGQNVYVSGEVTFDSTQDFTPGFVEGTLSRGALILHELGHLAGLDHVTDPNDIMYPVIGHMTHYGAGDVAGLSLLGTGGCVSA